MFRGRGTVKGFGGEERRVVANLVENRKWITCLSLLHTALVATLLH